MVIEGKIWFLYVGVEGGEDFVKDGLWEGRKCLDDVYVFFGDVGYGVDFEWVGFLCFCCGKFMD